MKNVLNPLNRFLAAVTGLLLVSCGYQLGGTKPAGMEFAQTVQVVNFKNRSLEPRAGTLVTGALADELQRDGTYRLSSAGDADIRVEGEVTSVSFEQLRSSRDDTYKSLEQGLRITVTYRVVDSRNNRVLYSNSVDEIGQFFDVGNIQTGRTNALGYVARRVATTIAENLTNG